MRIGFIVNDIKTEEPNYTTTFLAHKMHNLGHEVYEMGVGELAYYPDGYMGAHARRVPAGKCRTCQTYLDALQSDKAIVDKIKAPDLDVLMLRNDPASEKDGRDWARNAGIVFGQLALQHGVIVLNDPNSLSDAINKMYFQHFPEAVRPLTLITRDREEIREFFAELNGNMILKPLQGSGGANVFLVRKDDATNLNQMIEAITRDGYVIAQEYLPKAAEGDIRLFVVNGEALKHKGKYAALKRISKKGDVRNNMHAGGSVEKAEVTDEMLELVELVRPKLINDGMFMVGLDIVGNKLMEINVFSPGGLHTCSKLEGVDFSEAVVEALERKVHHKQTYQAEVTNRTIAVI
jgi:glutathione synthase